LPRISSLDPIGRLTRLRTLAMSTPPGYDASRKCHDVETLAPLSALHALEKLTMRGILPARDRLRPLHTLARLQSLDVSHVYAFGLEDYAGLARALPHASGHCLQPYFSAEWAGRCSRCQSPRVVLTAPPPRTSRFVCSTCQADRLEAHVQKWNRVLG